MGGSVIPRFFIISITSWWMPRKRRCRRASIEAFFLGMWQKDCIWCFTVLAENICVFCFCLFPERYQVRKAVKSMMKEGWPMFLYDAELCSQFWRWQCGLDDAMILALWLIYLSTKLRCRIWWKFKTRMWNTELSLANRSYVFIENEHNMYT